MTRFVDNVTRAAVMAMLGLLSVVVIAGTVDLALLLWSELVNPPFGVLEVREILEILGLFLMVLIGTAITSNEEKPPANEVTNLAEPPSDPLAELGVAPGSGAENVAEPPAKR